MPGTPGESGLPGRVGKPGPQVSSSNTKAVKTASHEIIVLFAAGYAR